MGRPKPKKSLFNRVFLKIGGIRRVIKPRKDKKAKPKAKPKKKAYKRERDPRLPPPAPKGHERAWAPHEREKLLLVIEEVQSANQGNNNWIEVERKLIEEHNVLRSDTEARNHWMRYMTGKTVTRRVGHEEVGEVREV